MEEQDIIRLYSEVQRKSAELTPWNELSAGQKALMKTFARSVARHSRTQVYKAVLEAAQGGTSEHE